MAVFTITERFKTIKQLATSDFRQSFLHLQHTGKKTILKCRKQWVWRGIYSSRQDTFALSGQFRHYNHQ